MRKYSRSILSFGLRKTHPKVSFVEEFKHELFRHADVIIISDKTRQVVEHSYSFGVRFIFFDLFVYVAFDSWKQKRIDEFLSSEIEPLNVEIYIILIERAIEFFLGKEGVDQVVYIRFLTCGEIWSLLTSTFIGYWDLPATRITPSLTATGIRLTSDATYRIYLLIEASTKCSRRKYCEKPKENHFFHMFG